MADTGGVGETRAAGAVLWRRSGSGIEVALVHRPRYDDWSFPKGKSKRGEHVLETAVREVTEETGLRPVLGRPLPVARYETDRGPKRVDYWAARPAPGGSGLFRPGAEVDDLRWLPLPAARDRLSYQRDVAMLDAFADGPADTVPLVLLRHAVACRKDEWTGDDVDRPLAAAGAAESERLARLLACFSPRRVISSAAERCVATVRPYAALAGTPVLIEPAFTVGQPSSPGAVSAEVAVIIAAAMPAVICAHRENLLSLLAAACAVLGSPPPEGEALPTAGFWVLHAAHGLVAATERHSLSPD